MKAKIATLAILSSALFSTNIFAAEQYRHYVATCSAGGFKGQVAYRVTANKTEQNGDYQRMWIHHYKIDRNGNKGGNSSNININTNVQNMAYRSPDNMKAGNWQRMDKTFEIRTNKGSENPFFRSTNIEFIFDKSNAPDPRCTINTSAPNGRLIDQNPGV